MSDKKPVHRAAMVNQAGGMSALCFAKPRAINLRIASWTICDEAVTCEKCKRAMASRATAEVQP